MSKRKNKNRMDKIKNIAQGPTVETELTMHPPPEPLAPLLNGADKYENGFAEAIGFCQPFGGQGGFPGGFSGQQVEDSTTIFENLRWYMVSNFRQMLSQAFVEIGLVQTICMVPVQDALRGGVQIKSKQLDEEEIKTLSLSVKRDGDLTTAGWAAVWERLFGGAGVLILVGDQDPEEELDIGAIGKDTLLEFRDVDMWELFWDKQNVEGYDAEIKGDDFEWYNYYAENVHKTRVLRLKGMKAPSFIRPRLRGWGVSVVEALVRSMNQYLKATDLGFEVLDEFKLDIYKIKNLVNTLVSPNGTNKVKERVQMANWQKNYQNAVVMDSEDDFDHKQLSFAGLAEAMEGIRRQVAADMRMPISKLFGTSENGGMNNTDQNDMENYNSMVEGEVRNKLEFHIVTILGLKCQKLFGYIPDDLEIEWKPLRELGAVDQETVKREKFARLLQAKAAGEITTLEFRDACNKGNLFDVQLDTTDDALNEIEAEQDKDAAVEAEGNSPDGGNGDNKPDSAKTKMANRIRNEFFTYSDWDRIKRFFNSAAFDRASYEADGGDEWISDQHEAMYTDPMGVDKNLWDKSKAASAAAFDGANKWKFQVWYYKKQGGKFL